MHRHTQKKKKHTSKQQKKKHEKVRERKNKEGEGERKKKDKLYRGQQSKAAIDTEDEGEVLKKNNFNLESTQG